MRTLPTASVLAFLALVCSVARAQGEDPGDEPVSGIYVEHFSGGEWLAVPGFPNRNAIPPESAVNPAAFLPVAGARHISAIFNDTGNLRLQVRALGHLGTVSAYEVVRLDANSLTSTISHNPGAASPAPVLGWLEANSILGAVTSYRGDIARVRVAVSVGGGSLSGSLSALNGTITTVEVNGTLTGSLFADQGSIGTILVTNGAIGTPSLPVTIRCKNGIGSVAAPSVSANITSNFGNSSTASNQTGWLNRLETTATGGNFTGSITTNQLGRAGVGDFVRVRGNFSGDLTTGTPTGNVVIPITIDGVLPAGRRLNIGQSLVQSSGSINLPSGGLQGQIIVNQGNINGAVWGGAVNVDGFSLTPSAGSALYRAPYYTAVSGTFGGGAVGLVPFHLYDTDSSPQNMATPSGLFDNTLHLRFYGPLTWTQGMPVSVRWMPWNGGALPGRNDPAWINISGDFSVAGNHSRELQVIPATYLDYASGSAYSVVPASGTSIWCDGVGTFSGTPYVDFYYVVAFPGL